MTPIHDDAADTRPETVGVLLRAQWPGWAGQRIVLLDGSGTDHAMYRLGASHVGRFPRTPGAAASLDRETVLLPRVAAALPVRVPPLDHVGSPGAGYPYRWAVLGWIEGEDAWAARQSVDDPRGDDLAHDLADLVLALRSGPALEVPRRRPGQRGGPLVGVLERADRWLSGAEGPLPSWVDAEAVRAVLDADRCAAADDVPYVPTHGDLIPGNLLVSAGRLAAVIDWGSLSLADPALDLVATWAVLGPRARDVFLDRLAPDEATWHRARANAVEQALGAAVYYSPRRHPLADVMARTLRRVLADAGLA